MSVQGDPSIKAIIPPAGAEVNTHKLYPAKNFPKLQIKPYLLQVAGAVKYLYVIASEPQCETLAVKLYPELYDPITGGSFCIIGTLRQKSG